jgi:hypothetical protein
MDFGRPTFSFRAGGHGRILASSFETVSGRAISTVLRELAGCSGCSNKVYLKISYIRCWPVSTPTINTREARAGTATKAAPNRAGSGSCSYQNTSIELEEDCLWVVVISDSTYSCFTASQ